MKVDLIRKFKWYIVGFILVAIMLSVSLSFSAWDTLSFKAIMNANGGNFIEKPDTKYVLVDDLYLSDGSKVVDDNGNGIADVGDIVTFGNYYQDANTSTKSAIRWIVVDKIGITLTLLAEKVMAFGSFWGTVYYNSGNSGVWGATDSAYKTYNQNYMQSTVRAWLNSNDSNPRTDGGTPFSKIYDSSKPQFRGFLSEAFLPEEREYILPKTISGMQGAGQRNNPSSGEYGSGNDKVWLPSYIEMFSNTGIKWGTASDNLNDKQFSYFASGNSKIGSITAFALSQYGNYTMLGATHSANHQDVSVGSNVWWWLRSPSPAWTSVLCVDTGDGYMHGGTGGTNDPRGGVRPAICLPL